MYQKELTLEEQLYRIGLVVFVITSLLLTFYLVVILPNMPSIPCIFFRFLGIYCPGCGGTRSVIALLHGNLLSSLWYHPVVLYSIVIYGGFMISHTMEKLHIGHIKGWKFREWHLYGALFIVISNWILKNILLLKYNILL